MGDPVNVIRIFNEKEVDELVLLDITASAEGRRPPFEVIAQVTEECFMPLAYGGGVGSLEDMKTIFGLGVEKIVLNSQAVAQPGLVRRAGESQRSPLRLEAEVFDLATAWLERYRLRAEERYRRLDELLADLPGPASSDPSAPERAPGGPT